MAAYLTHVPLLTAAVDALYNIGNEPEAADLLVEEKCLDLLVDVVHVFDYERVLVRQCVHVLSVVTYYQSAIVRLVELNTATAIAQALQTRIDDDTFVEDAIQVCVAVVLFVLLLYCLRCYCIVCVVVAVLFVLLLYCLCCCCIVCVVCVVVLFVLLYCLCCCIVCVVVVLFVLLLLLLFLFQLFVLCSVCVAFISVLLLVLLYLCELVTVKSNFVFFSICVYLYLQFIFSECKL